MTAALLSPSGHQFSLFYQSFLPTFPLCPLLYTTVLLWFRPISFSLLSFVCCPFVHSSPIVYIVLLIYKAFSKYITCSSLLWSCLSYEIFWIGVTWPTLKYWPDLGPPPPPKKGKKYNATSRFVCKQTFKWSFSYSFFFFIKFKLIRNHIKLPHYTKFSCLVILVVCGYLLVTMQFFFIG